jgi:hypothetical protein
MRSARRAFSSPRASSSGVDRGGVSPSPTASRGAPPAT